MPVVELSFGRRSRRRGLGACAEADVAGDRSAGQHESGPARGCDMDQQSAGKAIRLVVVLVAALGMLCSCTASARRTAEEQAVDDALAARVEQVLLADSRIYARHIDVDANRGVIRLSGIVWTSDDLYEARRIAATVPGVTRVVDQLELSIGGRTGAR